MRNIKINLKDISVSGIDLSKRASTFRHAILQRKTLKGVEIPILKNVDFIAKPGDKIGIIGRNGSGKSSLLKVIAGIYPIKSGKRTVKGRIAPLIEMGVGFDGELTGRENIKLALIYSRRLGDYSKELEEKIIEFSELREKIDLQFKGYSSGMRSRLAFSVSIFQHPDILLLDEVFAAGDKSFVGKAKELMKKKFSDVPISILVNHGDQIIKDLCNKCYLIEKGEVMAFGKPEEVIEIYSELLKK